MLHYTPSNVIVDHDLMAASKKWLLVRPRKEQAETELVTAFGEICDSLELAVCELLPYHI